MRVYRCPNASELLPSPTERDGDERARTKEAPLETVMMGSSMYLGDRLHLECMRRLLDQYLRRRKEYLGPQSSLPLNTLSPGTRLLTHLRYPLPLLLS